MIQIFHQGLEEVLQNPPDVNFIIRLLFSKRHERQPLKKISRENFQGFQGFSFQRSHNSICLQRFVASEGISENHPTKFCSVCFTQHFGRNPLVFNQVFFNPGCKAWIPGVKSGALRLSLHLHRDPVVPPAARTKCNPYWLLLGANHENGEIARDHLYRTSHPPRRNINNYKTDHYFRSSLFYRFGCGVCYGSQTDTNQHHRTFNRGEFGM